MSKVMTYQAGRNHFVMIARDHRDKNVEQVPKMYYYTSEKSASRKFERVCQSIRPRCGYSTYIAMGVLTNPNPVREHTIEMLPLPPQGQAAPKFDPLPIEGTALLGVYKETDGKKTIVRFEYTKIGVYIDLAEDEQASVLYTFKNDHAKDSFKDAMENVRKKMTKRELVWDDKEFKKIMKELKEKRFF